jgi:uncharacterized protein (DUF952 family)
MIFHVTTSDEWLAHRNLPTYKPNAFEKEGFIHCSTAAQLSGVLERYFAGKENLIILHIEESKLTSPLKYEAATNNELFPHVFGPINKEAIVNVIRK